MVFGITHPWGCLVGFLHGLTVPGSALGMSQPRHALETILVRGAWLTVLGLAGYAVYRLFQGLYTTSKPPPGYYGHPTYGQPYPQQPATYAQPAYQQPQQDETKITNTDEDAQRTAGHPPARRPVTGPGAGRESAQRLLLLG